MIVLLSFLLFFSCDFTPPLSKEVLQAQSYISNQEYEKAVKGYKNILKKNPSRELEVKIQYQLGDIHSIYLNKNKEALHYYKNVIKLSKDPLWLVKTEERLGDVYFSYLKNYNESKKVYKNLSSFNPPLKNQDTYRIRYALSNFYLGNLREADSIFDEISKNKKSKYGSRSLYYRALCSFEEKNWSSTIDHLDNYIKRETRQDYLVEAKFLMANSYESLEKLKNAYNIYYSILGEYPNTEVIQNRLKGIYDRRIARKR
jgi:tetratricopeptide (TPR) repeat protein